MKGPRSSSVPCTPFVIVIIRCLWMRFACRSVQMDESVGRSVWTIQETFENVRSEFYVETATIQSDCYTLHEIA